MNLFQSIRFPFKILGIYELNRSEKHQFNLQNCVVLFFLSQYAVTTALFFAIEAKTFSEYANTFYSILTMIFLVFTCAEFIAKATLIFSLIHDFEDAIGERELHPIQNED